MTEILKKSIAEVINENLVQYLDCLKRNLNSENFGDLIKESIEIGTIDLTRAKAGEKIFFYCVDNNLYKSTKFILKYVDPSADNNKAIILAAKKGYTEIVKVLPNNKRVDPSVCCNSAIHWAKSKGHAEVVEILLKDERVKKELDLI